MVKFGGVNAMAW